MTLNDYLSGAETARLRELTFGVVREPPAPTWGHQVVVGNLFDRLHRHVQRYSLGRIAQAPVDVVLDRRRALVVQPDLVFVSSARLGICKERIWGAPDLAIEVLSWGTRRHDSGVKVEWFRRYGMPECWLVDSASRTIEVVSLTESTRTSRVFEAGRVVRSPVLSRLRLRPAHIFTN